MTLKNASSNNEFNCGIPSYNILYRLQKAVKESPLSFHPQKVKGVTKIEQHRTKTSINGEKQTADVTS